MEEKNFAELDANFKSREIGSFKLEFHDGFASPFVLEGFPYIDREGRRSRLPLNIAAQCDMSGVYPMSMQGAGEVIRFRTNSPAIGIRAGFTEIFNGNNRGGSNGFDLYTGSGANLRFRGNRSITPGADKFEALYSDHLPADGTCYDCTLYFPYHSAVSAIAIGLVPGSTLEPPTPHKTGKPVVFYGSSITNCGSAGRPGLVYPAIIARELDFHLINMGLSGSCRGELCVADTIAELDIAALVLPPLPFAPSGNPRPHDVTLRLQTGGRQPSPPRNRHADLAERRQCRRPERRISRRRNPVRRTFPRRMYTGLLPSERLRSDPNGGTHRRPAETDSEIKQCAGIHETAADPGAFISAFSF